MSFRTVAQLDTTRGDVIKDFADRNRMHKRLMSLYPDGLGERPRQAINLIFTADVVNGTILFQSDLRPVVSPLNQARNNYFTEVITKPTEAVGMSFSDGDTVQFQLWYAATERQTGTKKRVELLENSAVIAKVTAVLAKVGLDVSEMSAVDRQNIQAASRGVSYQNVELAGSGVVTNAEHLREAIVRGIGSGRLWGSGVLLVSQ